MQYDGHDFVRSAFECGAAAAVVDEHFAGADENANRIIGGYPLEGLIGHLSAVSGCCGQPLLQVFDTRRALRDMAAGYRKSLAMQVVAITGSAGKTTVKEMTADILSTAAPTARTTGNFNNDIGVPLSVFAADKKHRYGVFEVGMNHPGELAPLCDILSPICSIITSVGPVHLLNFENERGIAEEKAEVFRALRKSGRAILCRDEKWFDMLRSAANCRVITTSLKGHADYVATNHRDGTLRFTVTEKSSGDAVVFTAPLPGDFIIHDALLAVAAARNFGLDWPDIVSAIANYRAAPMRWQRENVAGIAFINDCYNANPLSMSAALGAFAAMPVSGRRYVVLGGMLELGATERAQHEETGRVAARPEFVSLIAIGERGGWIADGAEKGGVSREQIHRMSGTDDAAELLCKLIRSGDAVLLKASRGERLERVLEACRRQFSA